MDQVRIDPIDISRGQKDKQMDRATKMFESYFLFLLLKEMGKMAHLEKKGFSADTYMMLLYERLADFLAEKGTGIGEMLKDSLQDRRLKFYNGSCDNDGKIRGGNL